MDFSEYRSYTADALASVDEAQIANLIELLREAWQERRRVFVIGNGGSAANASHFAQDLAKGTAPSPEHADRIRALALTDNVAFISALGNDEGYDKIFVQQLRTYAEPDDIVIAISGSGNSRNVLEAIEWGNSNGLETVGVTGFDGGLLRNLAKHSVHVPLDDMCTAESIHSVIFHYVVLELQNGGAVS